MGMLSWFVNKFVDYNALTPDPILILFIVSVLALAWAIFTLFSYHRSSHNALFVSFIDVAIVGALIAAVYYLRGIRNASCDDPSQSEIWWNFVGGAQVYGLGYDWGYSKPCSMLKACWAFGIMNCIFFAWSSFAAWMHGDHHAAYEDRKYRTRRYYHGDRHSHRHRSRSHGSRHSYRSPHSHRRVYV